MQYASDESKNKFKEWIDKPLWIERMRQRDFNTLPVEQDHFNSEGQIFVQLLTNINDWTCSIPNAKLNIKIIAIGSWGVEIENIEKLE